MIQRQFNSPLPARMKNLPVNKKGFPIPFFVTLKDDKGEPEFRCVTPERMAQAVRNHLCWVCGQKLGKYKSFAIGPMCGINKTIADPPSHKECATFAARNCPFMASPNARRRTEGLPEGHRDTPGVMIKRNPTAIGVWTTTQYRVLKVQNGILFRFGPPDSLEWYHHGRQAYKGEVLESIRTGYPLLLESAMEQGELAVDELKREAAGFLIYLDDQEWPTPILQDSATSGCG